jgi:Carbohydrate esterase, sialic acid-specific acetylesterase
MLGITERHGTSADITGYSSCINTLVTAVRNDVGRPDLPLLLTDYEQEATGDLAVTGTFAQEIIPEIHKVPMVVSNAVLVPTDSLGMQDDHHFNFDGHKLWVQRALQLMKDNGWWHW